MIPNEISGVVIGAAIAVHRALGPGLLEQPYKLCLAHELRKQKLHVSSEVALPVTYDEVTIDLGIVSICLLKILLSSRPNQ